MELSRSKYYERPTTVGYSIASQVYQCYFEDSYIQEQTIRVAGWSCLMKVSNVEDFEWFIIACKKQGVDNVVLKVAGGFAYIFRCLVAEESCIRQHVAGELRFRSMNIDEMTKLDQFEQCVEKVFGFTQRPDEATVVGVLEKTF
eukprot:TRINITY_DN2455_c0_g1_i2.p1 TRINITY_DN2455_c0_g1~~TRINITY_DN2455_c0_g1_i2.p1  ORF type:complete len:144 (-),score=18.36 TRINITY_DN2455_c0_g1_i2:175-606(-)